MFVYSLENGEKTIPFSGQLFFERSKLKKIIIKVEQRVVKVQLNVGMNVRDVPLPAFSTTFASPTSEVFTVNVRLLSANTSINTARRCTAYASFLTVPPVGRRTQSGHVSTKDISSDKERYDDRRSVQLDHDGGIRN